MIYLGNLGGVLNIDKLPLIQFKFSNDRLVVCNVLTKVGLPYEFLTGDCNAHLLRCFFNARIVPKSRFKLDESLVNSGIKYYIPERIIRFQKGRSTIDRYWITPDDDNTCWEESYVEHLCNVIGKREVMF